MKNEDLSFATKLGWSCLKSMLPVPLNALVDTIEDARSDKDLTEKFHELKKLLSGKLEAPSIVTLF